MYWILLVLLLVAAAATIYSLNSPAGLRRAIKSNNLFFGLGIEQVKKLIADQPDCPQNAGAQEFIDSAEAVYLEIEGMDMASISSRDELGAIEKRQTAAMGDVHRARRLLDPCHDDDDWPSRTTIPR